MRVDWRWLTSLTLGELTDAEFRSFLGLAAYVAQWREEVNPDGTFPVEWARFALYSRAGRRMGRVATRHVTRFLELGLVEDWVEAETGAELLRIADWRTLNPRDATGAERAARWCERHGLYGRRPRRYDDPPASHELEIPPHREGGS